MIGKLALYLPVLAVWIVLVGAVLNRARPVVVVPLVCGALAGITAVAMVSYWLLIPVVAAWLWGLVMLVRAEQRLG